MYTLAQSRTINNTKPNLIVNGKGSELKNKEVLKGRVERKSINQIMMIGLIQATEKTGETELKKSYWNTYYCQHKITTADNKLYTNYCKNRFCTTCCRIRKAEIINTYYPTIKQWKTPFLLTLTIKSCSAQNLPKYLKKFTDVIKKIIEKHRKRYQRGKGQPLVGIRFLECNFNTLKKTFNPHFQIITKDKHSAKTLLTEWLQQWTAKFANKKGQHIQRIDNSKKGLLQTIKYGSKFIAESNLKSKQTNTTDTYFEALNTIFIAMKDKRIYERFGFNALKQNKKQRFSAKLLDDYKVWEFDSKSSDWINIDTGEYLSN